MSDYSSRTDREYLNTAEYKEAHERKEELILWWGSGKALSARDQKSCPRCGASVAWHFVDATNAFLHMKFHEEMEAQRG